MTDYEIRQLEKQITALIQAGFTWKDAFTQCILQNTLIGFTRTTPPTNLQLHRLCQDALGVAGSWGDKLLPLDQEEEEEEATEEAINSEIASILLRLLTSAESLDPARKNEREIATSLGPEEEFTEHGDAQSSKLMKELLGSSQKRDEIVQVHKYFDKSKGTKKRDPYYNWDVAEREEPASDSADNYLLYYPGLVFDPADDSTGRLLTDGKDSSLYIGDLDTDKPGYESNQAAAPWMEDIKDVGGEEDSEIDPAELDNFIRESMAGSEQLPLDFGSQSGTLRLI